MALQPLTRFWRGLLLVAFVIACQDGGEPNSSDRASRPSVLEAESLSFSNAQELGLAMEHEYTLGTVTRTGLRADPTEPDRAFSFDSDPIVTRPNSDLLVPLGLLNLQRAISDIDRPKFVVEAIGPDREARLLEVVGQIDLSPNRWDSRRVPIPNDLGSPIVLRFHIEEAEGAAWLDSRAMPLWGIPRVIGPSERSRPNVLFVVFDTLRADHTTPYGYERETTPFLSDLASRGALVEEFVATYPTTLSSHWSMFSGLFPARHGVYPGSHDPENLPLSMANVFQDGGYRTAAFTEGGFVHSIFGFAGGFDLYHNGPKKALDDLSGSAQQTFGHAQRWLEDAADDPFFLFLHTYQVHTPYHPDPRFTQDLDPGYEERWKTRLDPLVTFAINSGKFEPSAAERERIVQLYDAEIREVDHLFSELWSRLDRLGVLDDTIVVVTSDHGEDFWEHDWLSHGTTLYDPALLVPFLVIADGRVAPGTRLACQRSQADLMPTLLDFADLPIPAEIDGHSMRAELERGECDEEDRAAYSELLSTFYDKRPSDLPIASLRKGGFKVIRHTASGNLEVYDLRGDPNEAHDVSGEKNEAIQALEIELDAYLGTGMNAIDPNSTDIPKEVRDRLKALGYGS